MTIIANTYDVGDRVRLQSNYTIDNNPTNPTVVFLFVKRPNNLINSYSTGDLTNSATGTFYLDITADASGRWDYRFESSGTVISADEYHFIVERSEF